MKEVSKLYESMARIEYEIAESDATRSDLVCDISEIGDIAELAEESGEKYYQSINYGIKNIAGIAEAHMDDIDALLDKVRKIAITALKKSEEEKEEEKEGHTPTEEEWKDLCREEAPAEGTEEETAEAAEEEWITALKKAIESKRKTLDLLLPVIQSTRAGEDVTMMELVIHPDKKTKSADEYVTIIFNNSAWKRVCITADSNIAMIMDICKALM